MVYIKPFKALRPREELVSRVSSLPYDVISKEEARKIIRSNPYSFLKVIKPDATLRREKYNSQQLAEIAAENLQEFIRKKILLRDEEDCFYLYRQSKNLYQRTGLVACLSAKDYLRGIIKKHENINMETCDARINHIKVTRAHTGCVLIIYKNNQQIEELLNRETSCKKAIYDFESDDGIKNSCWKIKEKEIIVSLIKAFQNIPSLYIADGHHRAAAAAIVVQLLESRQKEDEEKEENEVKEYMYFPAVLIPDNQVHLLAYHREVTISPKFDNDVFLRDLEQMFQVQKVIPNDPFLPTRKHEFGMNLSGQWYRLLYRRDILSKQDMNIINQLDVSILQDLILNPLLGIGNPPKSNRIEFLGGEISLLQIEERVKQGSIIAFTLYPTSVNEVIEISEMQQIMPPKSTWFEPKVRSGIFVHLFD
ncbi:MAG: DUF1015 family protein [Atribacterota bacterium]|nr:DUF1015 family protein [Atribacterota bacterium]MDD4895150.1 DUF1015 family protein [Atribacterota bacterium]MDD5637201.1 DUF1015 family protein [Atribacterota bacterium]